MNLLLTGLLCVTLSAPEPGDDKQEAAAVKAKAEEVLQLLQKGEYKKVAGRTHPRVVKEMGGSEKMADTLAAKMKQLKEQGYEVRSLKANDPTTSATVGDERYVVVPYTMEMKSPGGKTTVESYLLAISSDKGKTWTFVDGAGLADVEAQKKLLPDLPPPPTLRLPRTQRPVFEADRPERLVVLGDSITDGHTLPLLVRQALAEAKKPVPVVINAGVGGDTAAGMRKRLERDVLSRKPTLVLLSAGVNDVLHGVKAEDYESEVVGIAVALRDKKIPLVLLTPTVLGPKHEEADKKLGDFIFSLGRVSRRYDAAMAEVNQQLRTEQKQGTKVLEDDQVHLTFAGYRVLARAVLDALGHKDVPVPKELKPEVMPGLVRDWKVKALDKADALDDKAVTQLKPDESWKALSLPQREPLAHWWADQERQRGFAQELDKLAGPGKAYLGVATVESVRARRAFLNTGAQLSAVWLNGKRVYKSDGWTGWHAGKERVPIDLKDGKNTLVIETGPAFFLSITDDDQW
ncbi:MAG TPA: GDSL-type esterase/lipase family protein [Gemmataceae bacterium]|nr:GDSL-type esterase/lipase family protein [Gemmataceae bacterium]